jgi:phospholipid-translocating ATPase
MTKGEQLPLNSEQPQTSLQERNETEMSEMDRLVADLETPPPRKTSLSFRLKLLMNVAVNNISPRTIAIGEPNWVRGDYPPNEINNCRYSLLTFLPLALLNQFKMFFNIFFLAVAVSQFIPSLQVGFIFIYFAPLAFVVSLSLIKDAVDDIQRYLRDKKANAERYHKLLPTGEAVEVEAKNIVVGDLLIIEQNCRIPADCVLLHTTEKSGASFVRTDQLDGETDWKLRFPLKTTENLTNAELGMLRMNLRCEDLHKDIYKFVGQAQCARRQPEGITLENTLWSNCVLASGTVVGAVIHTGVDTRSAMNAARAASKLGLIDHELNFIGILCFGILVVLAFLLVVQQGFQGSWFVMFIRFIILLSAIIPISMRVNLDVARVWYSLVIFRDSVIAGTLVRNSNIPEDLGRLQYLFSDKTGTLTKNIMEFRSLQMGAQFTLQHRDVEDFQQALSVFFASRGAGEGRQSTRGIVGFSQTQIKEVGTAILCLALCHNVTPVTHEDGHVEFQASSPDEVAMVKFADSVGVKLLDRTLKKIVLRATCDGTDHTLEYEVLKMFPFTSERKSMSIFLRDCQTNQFYFFMKGADVKMMTVVRKCDWIDESCQELAQKGLRTLVFAQKPMTESDVKAFLTAYEQANAVMGDSRPVAIESCMQTVERGMDLVAITGVEDQLQDDVTNALETLGMCGLKVWMLTGDKVETAVCIGRSTQLISRQAHVEYLLQRSRAEVIDRLDQLRQQYDPLIVGDYLSTKWALITDGTSLAICLEDDIQKMFADIARIADSVIVARCSPTQKAAVVQTIRKYSPNSVRTAAIGDGGNDVSMILAANVGIGVEGVEGKQASMAADFSITKFSHCLRLIMWHGRNSYRRSCHLCQFIMHRGIVYSVVQAVFSVLFAGSTMSVFNGYLLMGYATVFTMAPVFSLVLNEDQREDDVCEFPQLYKQLIKARSMNMRSFLQWVWVSFFQGGVMMTLSLQLFGDEMFQIVTIAFTSLLITELVIVAGGVNFRILWKQRRMHFWLFLLAELFSVLAFFIAVLVLPDTIDKTFFFSASFASKVAIISIASIGPVFVFWLIGKYILCRPQIAKLKEDW